MKLPPEQYCLYLVPGYAVIAYQYGVVRIFDYLRFAATGCVHSAAGNHFNIVPDCQIVKNDGAVSIIAIYGVSACASGNCQKSIVKVRVTFGGNSISNAALDIKGSVFNV